MGRPIPQAAVNLVKQFEGCRLDAYPDVGTGAAPWTIGYGHTGLVNAGDSISSADAERLLGIDLAKAGASVESLLSVAVNDNEFSALVSFCFNLGSGNLRSSTLLRKLNGRDISGAADEFVKWDRAAGRVLAGLLARREAERTLFLTPDVGGVVA